MVQVKVVRLLLGKDKDTAKAEAELTRLRNEGWRFALAGGGTGKVVFEAAGFVVLEREIPA